jgi:hypothetical protein
VDEARRRVYDARMITLIRSLALSLALALCVPVLAAAAAPEGHAHNDYEHARPLLDALDAGFGSVEADIWLVDDQLRIGHDFSDLELGRTLKSLYLDPLKAMAEAGTLEPLILLIDIKSEGESTYAALERVLADYSGMLTRYEDGKVVPGKVTAIVSGNRPLATMQAETSRLAFYDGRLSDLGGGLSPDLMPLVSDNWTKNFSWTGAGEMPANEAKKLEDIVGRAHAAGYKVRFWDTPETPGPDRDKLWRTLSEAGVDFINTDDLQGFAAFRKELSGD